MCKFVSNEFPGVETIQSLLKLFFESNVFRIKLSESNVLFSFTGKFFISNYAGRG